MLHFIDHTGHIFGLTSYASYPIGYEYETTNYIFWVNDEYSLKLSVNNYYVLPIRFISETVINNLSIKIDSNVFSFGCIDENLEIDEKSLKKELKINADTNDLNVISGVSAKNTDKIFNIYTFYVFANAKDEGTWTTNILINISDSNTNIFCPISIGATFINESEQLVINTRNIGVELPKDICKAVYQESFFNDVFNERLYNEKLKEYLINHMIIKSECGNYNSALASLKWFGWGDNIKLTKMLQTDNQFFEQFIHRDFSTFDNISDAFKHFKQSTYLSLTVNENVETGDNYQLDFSDASGGLFGEGNPKLKSLFDETVFKTYDEGDIQFLSTFYKYEIHEIMYKLSCVAQMYKKYFLPIHLNTISASVKHRVFANSIKFITSTNTTITETPVLAIDQSNNIQTNVTFPNTSILYLYNRNLLYMDENFNIFEKYTKDFCETSIDKFYSLGSESISVYLPILFESKTPDAIFDCTFVLSRENVQIFESKFAFTNNDKYLGFVIAPKCFSNTFDYTFWDSQFTLDVLCNGKWYKYNFTINIPDLDIEYYKLKYVYDNNTQRQINSINDNSIDFNADIFEPGLVQINDINFYEKIYKLINKDKTGKEFNNDFNDDFLALTFAKLNDGINLNTEQIKISNNEKYLNRIYIYDITNAVNHSISIDNYNFAFTENSVDPETGDYIFKPHIIDIYNIFFDNNGNHKIPGVNNYDFYLMHNNRTFYGVFISKNTVDDFTSKRITDELSTLPTIVLNYDDNSKYYKLTKYKYSDTFLINRMQLVKPDELDPNKNHFDADDIIVSKIDNINMPYIASYASKWEYNKISIGGETLPPVYSKTNVGIMSVDKDHLSYISGYYDVKVTYAIDDYFEHSKIVKSKILIK